MLKTQTIRWGTFSDKHKRYIKNALKSDFSVAEGAIRSGKTIDHCIIAAAYLEKCHDKIHLASGSTLPNAKLNIGACNGFGLENLFRGRCRWGKYKENEALFINTQTGEKIIIFSGGGKADSYKKILGNSYGMWIATEINEHYDSDDSRTSFIKVAMGRQVAAEQPFTLWDLNPCNPNHDIYKRYIDRFLVDYGGKYCYEHFTIDDNATVTPERKRLIESKYTAGSVWYRRDILGERCVAEGLIYDMFGTAKHVAPVVPKNERGEPEPRKYTEYMLSCDYGTQNATVFLLWGYCKGVWYIIKEYYYSGRDKQKQKTDEEYYQDLVKFAGDTQVNQIIVDPSAASFIATIRRHNRFIPIQANNSVVDGIRFTGSLISAGKLMVCDCCKNLLDEIQGYCWEDNAQEDKPIKEKDHAMDAMRYMCYTHIRRNAYKYGINLIGRERGGNSGNN